MKIFLLLALIFGTSYCEFYRNLGKSQFKANVKFDNSTLPTANQVTSKKHS